MPKGSQRLFLSGNQGLGRSFPATGSFRSWRLFAACPSLPRRRYRRKAPGPSAFPAFWKGGALSPLESWDGQ